MSEGIMAAVITGVLSLLGVMVSNLAAAGRTEQSIRISQAVTDAKLEALTREVREHNGFARRMPVVEEQIRDMERRMEMIEEGKG